MIRIKKLAKRFGILLMAAFFLAGFKTIPARAADGDYGYTVRFFSGQQGTFAGGRTVITYEGLSYGSTVTFNPNGGNVVLNDGSKYYIKGIRESGRDNNTVSAPSFEVTGDRDYVVAYGLRGNMVAYTVNYLDLSGNALAPSETYYGNVGDKPVVAFLYIDGYQPQAYNLTKTLAENEAENVFTFVYAPLAAGEFDVTTTMITMPGTIESAVQVIPGQTRRGTAGRGSRTVGNADDNTADGLSARAGADGTSLEEPFDSIDLDGIELENTAVPLANMKFNLGPIEVDARMLLILLVVLIDIVVITVISYWYWKPYRKKESNGEKSASQPV